MSITTRTQITYRCDAPDCDSSETMDVAESVIGRLEENEHLVAIENLPLGWGAVTVNPLGRAVVMTVTACSKPCLLELLDPELPGVITHGMRTKPRPSKITLGDLRD